MDIVYFLGQDNELKIRNPSTKRTIILHKDFQDARETAIEAFRKSINSQLSHQKIPPELFDALYCEIKRYNRLGLEKLNSGEGGFTHPQVVELKKTIKSLEKQLIELLYQHDTTNTIEEYLWCRFLTPSFPHTFHYNYNYN